MPRCTFPFAVFRSPVLFLMACLVMTAALVGCDRAAGLDDGKLQVAVSIAPQKWLAEQLLGEHGRVIVVIPPNADAHTYSPSDAEVSRLMRSRLFFTIGMPFEEQGPWRGGRAAARYGLEVVNTTTGISFLEMDHECDHDHDHEHHHHHHDHGGLDPHVWLSPRLLKIQASNMAEALIEAAPDLAEDINQNLEAVHARLDELDAELTRILEPYRGRMFLVYHPAWGYLAHDYGLNQMAIEISGQTPSEGQLTGLLRLAREAQTRVVFVQPQISDVTAEAIAGQLGGRVEVIDPLAENLYDNLIDVAERIAASFADPN
ncbi:MAG: zinc ABC transporter substrate-binding protein [Phycisphaeraceae bacterium]|nr:zinc ABC transporter substrate-binding protein [Phycisphaeraceae bacterium]